MRRILQIAVILGMVLFLGSCTKYSFQSMDQKVLGTWTFEKVMYKPGLFKGRVNVTKDFANWEFTFERNGLATAYNVTNNEIKRGYWQMERYDSYYYDEDGGSSSSSDYVLRFELSSRSAGTEYYIWNIGSITAKRLRASEQMGNETYSYVMERK